MLLVLMLLLVLVMMLLVLLLVVLKMMLAVELRNERVRVVGRKSWMLRVGVVLVRRGSMMLISAEGVGRGGVVMIRVGVRKRLPSLNRLRRVLSSSRVNGRRFSSPTSRRLRLRR